MGRILASIRSLFRRAPGPDEQAAPRFVISAPARLLLSLSRDSAPEKLIASTLNVSASGLAVLVPHLYVGARPVGEGDGLKIKLDLHPLRTVEIEGLVVRVEVAEENPGAGHVLEVKITLMSEGDRALYLQYIGTMGWERVLSGNDKL